MITPNNTNHVCIVYHNHCADGFGAYYAVAKACEIAGVTQDDLACDYGEWTAESLTRHLTVLSSGVAPANIHLVIVDFSFPPPMMQELCERFGFVTWLDHHKSAFDSMGLSTDTAYTSQGADHVFLLDNERSGARLAWEYFHPGTEVPKLIKAVDDRDRWVFRLPHTREIHAALLLHRPWNFAAWDRFSTATEELVQDGAVVLEYEHAQMQAMGPNTQMVKVPYAGELVPVHALNSSVLHSELGNRLARAAQTGIGMVYTIDAEGMVAVSLRSIAAVDVSNIAKAFGGGGHKNAAGFKVSLKEFASWL